ELPAAVKCDGLRAVRVEDVGENLAQVAKGGGPIDRAKAIEPAQAKLRVGESIRGVDGGAKLGPFGTDAAEVGRRRLDAADSNRCSLAFKPQPAADPTIGADSFTRKSQRSSLCACAEFQHPRCARVQGGEGT